MDLTPAFNTGPRRARPVSYSDYLKSSEWRRRREARRKVANYRCERCNSKRDIQVHHKSYERLGHELDSDLEVLCKGCHEDHHITEDARINISLYIKLAGEVLRETVADDLTYPDFVDLAKKKCAIHKIPYDTGKLARALDIALKRRPGIQAPPPIQARLERGEDVAPPTQSEAASILKQLNIKIGLRSMPRAKPLDPFKFDKLKALKITAQEIEASIARCEELEKAVAK